MGGGGGGHKRTELLRPTNQGVKANTNTEDTILLSCTRCETVSENHGQDHDDYIVHNVGFDNYT